MVRRVYSDLQLVVLAARGGGQDAFAHDEEPVPNKRCWSMTRFEGRTLECRRRTRHPGLHRDYVTVNFNGQPMRIAYAEWDNRGKDTT